MNNHSEESNKRESNISEDNNSTNKEQSDVPLELLLDDNNENICNLKKNEKDKKQVQNILMLNKPEKKKIKKNTISSVLINILFFLNFLIFADISIIDIIFQIINPNGINPYLIDDLLIIILPSILIAVFINSDKCIKYSTILQVIVSSIIVIILIGSYIADNIIFFKYFYEKNKSPNYIRDFYLSYIIIKFSCLGLGIIFIIIIGCRLLIISKEKREEEINSIQLSPLLFSPDN